MKNKLTKTIFTIVFVVFLGLSFGTVEDVYAANFTCEINSYKLEYNSSGNLVSASKDGTKVNKYMSSYFHPKSESECPTEEEAKVYFVDGGRTLYVGKIDETFTSNVTCTLNGYELEYNSSGNLVSASKDGTKVNKNMSSHFHPKSASECPKEEEAKVYFIDGRRTLYVGKIDEDFAEEFPTSPKPDYGDEIGKLEKGNSTVGCGTITDIPKMLPTVISIIYIILQIVVPIMLIIFGMIDIAKSVSAQKEDEIKKGQQTFIKRCIASAIIFLVFSVVKLVISSVSDSTDVTDCLNCFIDNDCKPGYDASTGNDYTQN